MTQSAFKGEPFGYTSKGDPILYDKDLDQFAVEKDYTYIVEPDAEELADIERIKKEKEG